MKIVRKEFGMLSNGEAVELWELKAAGLVLTLTKDALCWLSYKSLYMIGFLPGQSLG